MSQSGDQRVGRCYQVVVEVCTIDTVGGDPVVAGKSQNHGERTGYYVILGCGRHRAGNSQRGTAPRSGGGGCRTGGDVIPLGIRMCSGRRRERSRRKPAIVHCAGEGDRHSFAICAQFQSCGRSGGGCPGAKAPKLGDYVRERTCNIAGTGGEGVVGVGSDEPTGYGGRRQGLAVNQRDGIPRSCPRTASVRQCHTLQDRRRLVRTRSRSVACHQIC